MFNKSSQMENIYMVQISKVHARQFLPLNYNDTMTMKQILSTKHMSNIQKQYMFKNESHLTHNFIKGWKTNMRDKLTHNNLANINSNYAFI